MDVYEKLPHSKGEFALFIAVISVLSVNIIAPLITCFEFEFSLAVWADVLAVIPFIWLSVVAFVLLTYRPAQWLTNRICAPDDSFRARVTVNILCTVLLMSALLTVVGTWIGSRSLAWGPIRLFFYKWPRNFALSLGVEALVAQPIARWVMQRLHRARNKKHPAPV